MCALDGRTVGARSGAEGEVGTGKSEHSFDRNCQQGEQPEGSRRFLLRAGRSLCCGEAAWNLWADESASSVVRQGTSAAASPGWPDRIVAGGAGEGNCLCNVLAEVRGARLAAHDRGLTAGHAA